MQVSRNETLNFSHSWTYQGVSIPMTDVHIAFAADWANIVLRNFIAEARRNAAEARKREEAKKLVLTDPT